MEHYKYLIVGGGMTGDAAVRGIRKLDADGSIAMFSLEADPPYNRPLLTKGLWKGKTVDKAWRRTEQFGAKINLQCSIVSIDVGKKTVLDANGRDYSYDRLLLATGGTPRKLPVDESGDILYYRTMQDYLRLRQWTEKGQTFGVIGNGFIGSELAAALAMNGKEAIMVFPGEGIGAPVYPKDVSQYLNDFYRQKGVRLVTGAIISGVFRKGGKYIIQTSRESEIPVDGVIVGIGIRLNTTLAESAGLQVDNDGIVVDEYLRTSAPDVFAAGDVASFYSSYLDRRMHVEHEDNANTMGELAGSNMANSFLSKELAPYNHLPYFYSDLFEIGYEAVGELDSRHEIVADWKDPYKEGVLYYVKDGKVRGVLLWNVWSKIPAARALIAEPGPFRPHDLIGKIN
jgi:3-phenylpropionate/trans-cinnamate dioxygenase ferredoxin reductase subunit